MVYAIVDDENLIQNIILWDGISKFDPGSGLTLILLDAAIAGGATYP